MENIMITGASRGIGLEFVRQYNADDWRIFACCRTPGQASELNDIAAQSDGRVTVHQLDVDDTASVTALKAELGNQPLDVLLNNAGIMGQRNAARDARWIASGAIFRRIFHAPGLNPNGRNSPSATPRRLASVRSLHLGRGTVAQYPSRCGNGERPSTRR